MKKKKLAILTLSTLMTMSMIACGNTNTTTESTSKETTNNTTELVSEVNTTKIDTEQNTEQKTEKSTSFNSKAEELINSTSQLQSNHKDETMKLSILTIYEFAEERSTGEFDMSNVPEDAPGNYEAPVKMETVVYKKEFKGDFKYSSKVYSGDIKLASQSDYISTTNIKAYIDIDNKISYSSEDNKWTKNDISQLAIDNSNPLNNFSVNMFESYDIKETDTEYVVTGKSKVNKLNDSIKSLLNSLELTTDSANVSIEIKFDKNTNEFKTIDFTIENITDLEVELNNIEILITNNGFDTEAITIPQQVLDSIETTENVRSDD